MFPVPWLVWLCLSEAAECHSQVCLSGPSKPLEVVGVYNHNFLIIFCFSQASSHYLREYIYVSILRVINHSKLAMV